MQRQMATCRDEFCRFLFTLLVGACVALLGRYAIDCVRLYIKDVARDVVREELSR